MTISEATANAPATVYRLFDAEDRLLYVGVAKDPTERFKEHRRRDWWALVARTAFTEFPDRDSALDAERKAIAEELPAYNVRGNPDAQWGTGSSGLRIRGFPNDVLAEAKYEAAIDGVSLRAFAIEAAGREVERRRAIPMDERRRLRLERDKP